MGAADIKKRVFVKENTGVRFEVVERIHEGIFLIPLDPPRGTLGSWGPLGPYSSHEEVLEAVALLGLKEVIVEEKKKEDLRDGVIVSGGALRFRVKETLFQNGALFAYNLVALNTAGEEMEEHLGPYSTREWLERGLIDLGLVVENPEEWIADQLHEIVREHLGELHRAQEEPMLFAALRAAYDLGRGTR